jgi:hypothetical protein
MKAEILKIAKVKDEKSFYKKYPSEEAFMKVHGKEFKKAQIGAQLEKAQFGFKAPGIPQEGYNVPQQQTMLQGPMNQSSNYYQNNNPFFTTNPGATSVNNPAVASPEATGGGMAGAMPYVQAGMDVAQGLSMIKGQKNKVKEAKQQAGVTGVQALAAESRDVDTPRMQRDLFKRERDSLMRVINGQEQFPVDGVGTNPLTKNGGEIRKARDGDYIGGNPTEIQNTYAPEYDLYEDLEYEPLNDSSQIKQFQFGGMTSQQGNISQYGDMATNLSNRFINQGGQEDAGSKIGGGIGAGIGTAFGGPIGGAIGKFAGSTIGGLIDTSDKKIAKYNKQTDKNIGRVTGQAFAQNLQQQNQSYMEDGGYVNPEYNPQLITMFGDHTAEDFADYANKFRAGGHLKAYTPPSERAMETYAMGGEVETTWGGYAEPISHNPYLPGTGQTVMFRGQSHDERDSKGRTGIGVKYGQPDSYTDYAEYGSEVNADVEVERNEPATELQNANGEKNLTVYGNLMIPKYGVDLLGDKNAKDKKFKNYVGVDLFKQENKGNKLIKEASETANKKDAEPLEVNTAEIKKLAGEMILKTAAERKIKAADLQNAINETAEEYGLIADDLARGKVKVDKKAMKEYAKFGKSIPKAQYGLEVWEGNKTGLGKKTASEFTLDQWNQVAKKYGFKGQGNLEFQKFLMTNPETSKIIKARHNILYGKNPETDPSLYDAKLGRGYAAAELLELPPAATIPVDKTAKGDNTKKEDANFETVPYKRSGLVDALGQILPYIRPTDQEDLSPNQLLGETYALSNNQVEPVQAIPVNPRLRVPYEINRNAAKNDLIAQVRAAQRMVQGNPAAQAYIAAQAYGPMQQLNEKDFIDNQAMRDAVYSGNIATLNDADAKNREIYDRQYARQSQARSNTKATAQAALNSISDKYSKNRLENKTLGIYENLYNYRYDKMGRAINMNAPFQPNIPYIYDKHGRITHKIVYDKNGKMLGYEPYSKGEELFLQETDENYVPIPEDGTTPIPSLSTGPIVPQGSFAPTGYVPIDEEEYTNQEYMDQVAPKKFGGKVNKKYSQSSIVRAFK